MHESIPRALVVEAIRLHLSDVHERTEFDPERDLIWPGHLPADGVVTYLPETERTGSGFICGLCGAHIFPLGPSFGHPRRVLRLLHDHPELRLLTQGLDTQRRAAVVTDWDRRRLAEASGRPGATLPLRSPAHYRVVRCQQFLLDRYVELGSRDQAIDALIGLAVTDPRLHRQIVGGDRALSRETYLRYWRRIPIGARLDARRLRKRGRPEDASA